MSQDLTRQFADATRFDTKKTPPSEVRSTPLLSSQVARLEQDRDALTDLCGEVLATVRVNWERGTLVTLPTIAKPENSIEIRKRFAEWLELWEARFKELKDNVKDDTFDDRN